MNDPEIVSEEPLFAIGKVPRTTRDLMEVLDLIAVKQHGNAWLQLDAAEAAHLAKCLREHQKPGTQMEPRKPWIPPLGY